MGALPANLSIGSMFRVLALLCLAVLSMGEPEAEAKAVADPKADPYLIYGGYYGLGHHYYGYPYYGYYGKRSAEAEPAPDADAKAEADPWYGYYGHGYGLGYYRGYYGGHYGYPYYGYYGKRSADAEAAPAADAKADPYLVYGHYGLGGYYGGYYGGYPYYYYGKRSADAEPAADAKADPWYGYYGLAHYGYGYPHYGYGYGYYWGK